MTPRMWSILTGEKSGYVELSQRYRESRALHEVRGAWWTDRLLLIFTFGWMLYRIPIFVQLSRRSTELYEPSSWLAMLVMPELPSEVSWYILLIIGLISCALSLTIYSSIYIRISLAMSVVLLTLPEFGFGKIDHIYHLLMLAHLYAVFLPKGKPSDATDALRHLPAIRWYRFGVLFPYTMVGLWKLAEVAIRDRLLPGMTWLNPDALAVTSARALRNFDLPIALPRILDTLGPLFSVGYVLVGIILACSVLAVFRRPLAWIIVTVVLTFHALNMTHYVFFWTAMATAAILFIPFDELLRIRDKSRYHTESQGSGQNARFSRIWKHGEVDRYRGFHARRERLYERSPLLSAPLWFPGIAAIINRLDHVRHTRSNRIR